MLKAMISVIIPTYNNHRSLGLCLNALKNQSLSSEKFEVIIVNNHTTALPEELLSRFPNFRFVQEHKPGSYAARNYGIDIAKGQYFAFTDDDCIPDPDWLANGFKSLVNLPAPGIIGGKIQTSWSGMKPNWIETWELATCFPQDLYIKRYHFAVTANLFCSRETIQRVGKFNSNLSSGGDREFGWRVYKAGLPIVFFSKAIVTHPARKSFSEIYRKMKRVNKGHRQLIQMDSSHYTSRARSLFRQFYDLYLSLKELKKRFPQAKYYDYIKVLGIFPIILVMRAYLNLKGD